MKPDDILLAIEELSSSLVAIEYRMEDAQAELVRTQRLLWAMRKAVIDEIQESIDGPGVLASAILDSGGRSEGDGQGIGDAPPDETGRSGGV